MSTTPEPESAYEVGAGVALLHAAFAIQPLGDEGDDGVGRGALELGAVRPFHAGHVAGEPAADRGHRAAAG